MTSMTPARRSLTSTAIGCKRFVLVGPPALVAGRALDSLTELGQWLVGKPWVAFSAELPLTRRFWLSALGRPFARRPPAGRPRPPGRWPPPWPRARDQPAARFACAEALAAGSIVEVHPWPT